MNKKVILMILDGWGIATNPKVSAIDAANTPFIDGLYDKYPNSKLEASGLAVGLPEGQMGNSEVGHMNLGAGRVVYQDLVKVNLAVKDNTLKNEPALAEALDYAKNNHKNVHFIGLVSDGGVHSHIEHLKALCSIANEKNIQNTFIHAFTDGRDTDPKGGLGYLTDLQNHIAGTNTKIASITGRYFAMDRDNRWERVKLAYDAMVNGVGEKYIQGNEILTAIQSEYNNNITDEFIKPIIVTDSENKAIGKIEEGDVVLCFNFRTDRGREITQALTQSDFPEQQMKKLDLHYLTMTNYDDKFKNVNVIFDKDNLSMTLGEMIANAGKKQIRMAETEKYPHVTFFFSGGREEPFEGQSNILRNSPKVATYDLQPEMSAVELKDALIPEIKKGEADFVCLNFANTDMVGHTGVFSAVMKAAETVDKCAEEIVKVGLENNYTFIIIADHGNADFMINEDGTPNTAHTTSLVPCILADNDYSKPIKNGKLGDIAPTVLELLGVKQPEEMTGVSLL